jgi:hypothetical protein
LRIGDRRSTHASYTLIFQFKPRTSCIAYWRSTLYPCAIHVNISIEKGLYGVDQPGPSVTTQPWGVSSSPPSGSSPKNTHHPTSKNTKRGQAGRKHRHLKLFWDRQGSLAVNNHLYFPAEPSLLLSVFGTSTVATTLHKERDLSLRLTLMTL